jgi:hypothetical protein
MRLESKSVKDAARRNSQHLPKKRRKRKPTQRAQSTMTKHMFSQKLKGYPGDLFSKECGGCSPVEQSTSG